ncbi:hypothetical protein L6452_30610 [Arctium lappa]|uniref:Uncharacterized protein n=1 Tax=Arctium lappa TaxID=4217 RepID=A0ACB8ZI75_ARCLA|nr:hypothetical protein L6452_30610 [Arctium lappa]
MLVVVANGRRKVGGGGGSWWEKGWWRWWWLTVGERLVAVVMAQDGGLVGVGGGSRPEKGWWWCWWFTMVESQGERKGSAGDKRESSETRGGAEEEDRRCNRQEGIPGERREHLGREPPLGFLQTMNEKKRRGRLVFVEAEGYWRISGG